MASSVLVPVEEYLRTVYRPDCDYVDGEIVERNMGEQRHGRLQGSLVRWFWDRERRFGFRTLPEVRLQVLPNRYRVPDVMLIPTSAADEKIIRTPPLLCIEILSPEDAFKRIVARVHEYLALGVPVCWIIDPENGNAWTVTAAGLIPTRDGVLRAGEIEMPLAEVFDGI